MASMTRLTIMLLLLDKENEGDGIYNAYCSALNMSTVEFDGQNPIWCDRMIVPDLDSLAMPNPLFGAVPDSGQIGCHFRSL